MNRLMVSVVAAGCALAGFAEGFVVAKDGAAACAVVAGAAIDAPPPIVVSFQLFEGYLPRRQPSLRSKSLARCK